jgi:hypothetical protein
MKLDVFLPSLLVSPHRFANSVALRLPAIETLMARGSSHVGGEWPEVLLSAFGADGSVAALSASGDDISVGTHGWMFAEPAHFQADRNTLNLFPSSQLDITVNESVQLISALNANFADRGLTFSCGASGHWYVSCAVSELPHTSSIHRARRGNMFEKLPQSQGELSWTAIHNETQMLLHSHPINEARESAGKLTINGIWFWGDGAVRKNGIDRKPSLGAVFGDTPLAAGLAKWVDSQCFPIAQFTASNGVSSAGHDVLVIDALTALMERGDLTAWREAALKLDAEIFAPLLASLKAGTIHTVALTLPRESDSLIYSTRSQSLRGVTGFWKSFTQKTRPVAESSLA